MGHDMTHPGGRSESKLNDIQRTFSLDSDWIPAEVKWMDETWWLIETERDLYDVYLEESLWVDYFSFWGRAALGVEVLQRETPAVERQLLVVWFCERCYTDQLTVKLLKERFRWVSVCERGWRSGSWDMKCALKLSWVPPSAMLSITATSLGSISGWWLASKFNNYRGMCY